MSTVSGVAEGAEGVGFCVNGKIAEFCVNGKIAAPESSTHGGFCVGSGKENVSVTGLGVLRNREVACSTVVMVVLLTCVSWARSGTFHNSRQMLAFFVLYFIMSTVSVNI